MPIVISSRATVPGTPQLTSVTAGDSGATAAWAPLAFGTDGGSPLIRYVVEVRVAATGTLTLSAPTSPDATEATLRPLVNDVQYSVTLAAVNGVGTSLPSTAVLVTPTAGDDNDDPDDPDGPHEHVQVPQPALAAFPADRALRPGNWLLSAEEADAS